MGISTHELVHQARWLSQELSGAHVQELRQPDRGSLVLSFRNPGKTTHLLIDLHPGTASVHTVLRPPENPPRPHGLQGLLRNGLRGRLLGADAVGGDRILRLQFEGRDGGIQALVAELFPPRPELFVLGPEDLILGRSGLRDREPGGGHAGRRWTPPPRSGAASPGDLLPDGPELDTRLRDRWEAARVEQERVVAAREAREGARRMLRREENLLASLRKELPSVGAAAQRREEAVLLQTGFRKIPRDATEVLLEDLFGDSAPRRVPLVPGLAPQEQVRRAFREAARLERRLVELPPRIDALLARLDQTRRLLAPEQSDPTRVPTVRPPQAEKARTRRYRTAAGVVIAIGGNARENDALTWGRARPDHWWFHVRDRPGPHVVAFSTAETCPEEVAAMAGQLAASHAGLPTGERVEVWRVRVRDLRRARGAPPGAVSVYRGTVDTVVVRESGELDLTAVTGGGYGHSGRKDPLSCSHPRR